MEDRETQVKKNRGFLQQIDDNQKKLETPPRVPLAGKNPNLTDPSTGSKPDLPVGRFEINRPPPVPINPRSVPINPLSILHKWKNNDKLFAGKYVSSGCNTPCTPAIARNESVEFDYPPINRNREPDFSPLPSLGRYCSSFGEEFMEPVSSGISMGNIVDPVVPTLSRGNSTIIENEGNPIKYSRYNHNFVELEHIGNGNFGTVFKCRHVIDQLQYAMKKIKINVKSSYDVKKAMHEAFALAASSIYDDNSYIIRYHTVWIENGHLFLSMELCDCSLSRYIIREQAYDEEFIKKLMRDICKGLKKLHKNKIVHLDIKSENILYSQSGKFKLGDLGLACMLNNLSNEEINEGDSRYLAPELLQIIPDDSTTIPDLTKADIFSLGATILEIMRRKSLPKNGSEWHRIREGNALIKGNYTKRLKDTVRKMLSRDPEARPSASQLLDSFLLSPVQAELRKARNLNKFYESILERVGTPRRRRSSVDDYKL